MEGGLQCLQTSSKYKEHLVGMLGQSWVGQPQWLVILPTEQRKGERTAAAAMIVTVRECQPSSRTHLPSVGADVWGTGIGSVPNFGSGLFV